MVRGNRQRLAAPRGRFEPTARTWCAWMATIAPTPAVRGAGTAVGWITPCPFPVHWCSNMDEAWHWTRQRLLGHDIVVPTHPPRDMLARD